MIAPSAAIDGLYNWLKIQAKAGALLDDTHEVRASDVLAALPKAHVFQQQHGTEDTSDDALKAYEQNQHVEITSVIKHIGRTASG